MSNVKLKNVDKIFGRNVKACNNINLEIEEGEFLTLLGPSGRGKTTLLNIIAGLEKVTSGEVIFGESCVNDLPASQRNVAMVFQNYALYPHINIYENLQFSLKMRKVPKEERRQSVIKIAKMLSIDSLLDRKPREISGGQKQRVALGRALVRNPNLFLLDEPLSNLDAKLRTNMRAEIRRIHQHLGTTTIYVTHDQLEAMTMSDRIVVMDNGAIQQIGTPEEIYNQPINCTVAGFVGTPTMNFISCELFREQEACWLDFGFGRCELSLESEALFNHNAFQRKAVAGIRSEDIIIAEPGDQEALWGKVNLVELLGANKLLYIQFNDRNITALVAASFECDIGEKVGVRFNQERINLFDPSSEKSIK